MYLFYDRLHHEFRNMADVSAGDSVMTLEMDNAFNLYERITENQANWPIDRKVLKKAAGMHNIDAVTVLVAQLEVITKKLDKLTQFVYHTATSSNLRKLWDRLHHCLLPFSFHSQWSTCRSQLCIELSEAAKRTLSQQLPLGLNKHPNFSWVDNSNQRYRMKDNPLVVQQQ